MKMWQRVPPLCLVALWFLAQAHALPQNGAPSAAASVSGDDAAVTTATASSAVISAVVNLVLPGLETSNPEASPSSRVMVSDLFPPNQTPPAPEPTGDVTTIVTALPVDTTPATSVRQSVTDLFPPSSPPIATPATTNVPAIPEVTLTSSPAASTPLPPAPPSSTIPPPLIPTPPASPAPPSSSSPQPPSLPSLPPLPSSAAQEPSAAPPSSPASAPSLVVDLPGTLLSSIPATSSGVVTPPVATSIVGGPSSVVAPPPVVATSTRLVSPSAVSPPEPTAEAPTDAPPALPMTTQQVAIIPLPETTVAIVDGTTLAEVPSSVIDRVTRTLTGSFTGYTGPLVTTNAAPALHTTPRDMAWIAGVVGALFIAA